MRGRLIIWFIVNAMMTTYDTKAVLAPLVSTITGIVIGKLNQADRLSYYSYQGIPYAEKPVGKLRFMPPVPIRPWTHVLDATAEGAVCPQPEGDYSRHQMSEDCLFLNIYVPANRTTPLPVLVFVHGGEFSKLSGNADVIYGPQLLLARGVIVVTLNYRLGALGFLSLGIKEASGNAGIKDVLLALKWIKANIQNFGGDTHNITLAGNSAGAGLVHFLTLTPKSDGLFHRVIMISGSALNYRFLALHPVPNALALCNELGVNGTSTNDMLEKLRGLDPFDIVQAQDAMGQNNSRNGVRPFAPFVPCIEIEYEDALIDKHPKIIIQSGLPQNVPILTGFNAQEGIKMLPVIKKNPNLIDRINENFELVIPSNIEYPLGSCESRNLAKSIQDFYFGGLNITNQTINGYLDMLRDSQFAHGADSWIKLHTSRRDSNKIYYYVFTFDGSLNWFKLKTDVDFPGAAHADELGYLFVTKITEALLQNLDSINQDRLNIMLTLITTFVKYEKPLTDGVDNDFNWPESGPERNHYVISDAPHAEIGPPLTQHQRFWYDIYDQYNRYVDNGGEIEAKIVP